MIIFDLACEHGHAFEGWFNSSSDYDDQLRRGLLVCANCGSTAIRRVPSAPHLAISSSRVPQAISSATPTVSPHQASAAQGASKAAATASAAGSFEQAYQQLMAAIVARTEDVGSQFAEEARKIHYLEAPERAIRGQASDEEYEELRDEGIDVLRLPVVRKH